MAVIKCHIMRSYVSIYNFCEIKWNLIKALKIKKKIEIRYIIDKKPHDALKVSASS